MNKRLYKILIPVLVVAIVSIAIVYKVREEPLPIIVGNEAIINSETGGILQTNQDVEIVFPRGALREDSQVCVGLSNQDAESLGQLNHYNAFSEVWVIDVVESPYFDEVVTVKLSYSESEIPPNVSEEHIFPLYLFQGQWVPLPAEIDVENNQVMIETFSNGEWCLVSDDCEWTDYFVPDPNVNTIQEAEQALREREQEHLEVQTQWEFLKEESFEQSMAGKMVQLPGPTIVENGASYIYTAKVAPKLVASLTQAGHVAGAYIVKASVCALHIAAYVGVGVLFIDHVLTDREVGVPQADVDLLIASTRHAWAEAQLLMLQGKTPPETNTETLLDMTLLRLTEGALWASNIEKEDVWTYEYSTLPEEEPPSEEGDVEPIPYDCSPFAEHPREMAETQSTIVVDKDTVEIGDTLKISVEWEYLGPLTPIPGIPRININEITNGENRWMPMSYDLWDDYKCIKLGDKYQAEVTWDLTDYDSGEYVPAGSYRIRAFIRSSCTMENCYYMFLDGYSEIYITIEG